MSSPDASLKLTTPVSKSSKKKKKKSTKKKKRKREENEAAAQDTTTPLKSDRPEKKTAAPKEPRPIRHFPLAAIAAPLANEEETKVLFKVIGKGKSAHEPELCMVFLTHYFTF